mgnify:CR=1 FL=1
MDLRNVEPALEVLDNGANESLAVLSQWLAGEAEHVLAAGVLDELRRVLDDRGQAVAGGEASRQLGAWRLASADAATDDTNT